jgi:hypothetical protein
MVFKGVYEALNISPVSVDGVIRISLVIGQII